MTGGGGHDGGRDGGAGPGLSHFMGHSAEATPEGYRASAGEARDGLGKPDLAAVVDALKSVHDPEIPVNIYDLGLIYDILLKDGGGVEITMSLTRERMSDEAKLALDMAW